MLVAIFNVSKGNENISLEIVIKFYYTSLLASTRVLNKYFWLVFLHDCSQKFKTVRGIISMFY